MMAARLLVALIPAEKVVPTDCCLAHEAGRIFLSAFSGLQHHHHIITKVLYLAVSESLAASVFVVRPRCWMAGMVQLLV